METSLYQGIVISLGAFIAGLYVLIRCSEVLVSASSEVARRLGVSEFFVAATIVAFGTSAPEFFISLGANMGGYPGVALGNVSGSNVANVLVMMGIAALVSPIDMRQRSIGRDLSVMLFASLMLSGLVVYGRISMAAGVVMLLVFAASVFAQFIADRPDAVAAPKTTLAEQKARPLAVECLIIIASLVGLAVGGEFLVNGAVAAGRSAGLSETLIAMTVIAVGTSVPELATSVIAALRKKTGMIVGIIVGSNVFNILAILGVTSIVSPIEAGNTLDRIDLAMLVASALVLFPFAWRGTLPRWAGAAMIIAYAAYVAVQYNAA